MTKRDVSFGITKVPHYDGGISVKTGTPKCVRRTVTLGDTDASSWLSATHTPIALTAGLSKPHQPDKDFIEDALPS